jgi:hypothetical protein
MLLRVRDAIPWASARRSVCTSKGPAMRFDCTLLPACLGLLVPLASQTPARGFQAAPAIERSHEATQTVLLRRATAETGPSSAPAAQDSFASGRTHGVSSGPTRTCSDMDLSAPGYPATPTVGSLGREIAILWCDYRVQVHVCFNPETYFPAEWRRAPISAKGSQIGLADCFRSVSIIARFLSSYPPELIINTLSDVYVAGSLSLYGLNYGGTYGRRSIYLAVGSREDGYDDAFVSGVLHSEFSSILFHEYRFPEDDWSDCNEAGWRYARDLPQLLRRGDPYQTAEDLLQGGFLAAYSQVSSEEDVNMFVFMAAAQPARLFSAASKYARVRRKLDILTRFYEEVRWRLSTEGPFGFLDRLKNRRTGSWGSVVRPPWGVVGRERAGGELLALPANVFAPSAQGPATFEVTVVGPATLEVELGGGRRSKIEINGAGQTKIHVSGSAVTINPAAQAR